MERGRRRRKGSSYMAHHKVPRPPALLKNSPTNLTPCSLQSDATRYLRVILRMHSYQAFSSYAATHICLCPRSAVQNGNESDQNADLKRTGITARHNDIFCFF